MAQYDLTWEALGRYDDLPMVDTIFLRLHKVERCGPIETIPMRDFTFNDWREPPQYRATTSHLEGSTIDMDRDSHVTEVMKKFVDEPADINHTRYGFAC